MKYTFSFKETSIGSVTIESDLLPSKSEIINAIKKCGAYYRDTKYEDICFVSEVRSTPKRERPHER